MATKGSHRPAQPKLEFEFSELPMFGSIRLRLDLIIYRMEVISHVAWKFFIPLYFIIFNPPEFDGPPTLKTCFK